MYQIHASKLATSKYFSPTDFKQLLPMHQPTAIQNLRIILNNYALSKYVKNIIILPDQNLNYKDPHSACCYLDSKAVWYEDFDQKPDHLKNSLTLACHILNYIKSIDEDSPMQLLNKANNQFIGKLEICGIANGQKVQSKIQKYNKLKQIKTTIGVRFLKIGTRIYTLIGVNENTRDALVISSSILRKWNLSRLRISQIGQVQIDMLHRICEHLFCLGRGFVRQVSDDYNTYHSNVNQFLQKVQHLQLDDPSILCQLFKSCKLNSNNNLNQEIVVIRYHITLRSNISQQSIWKIISQSVVSWLLQTPLNASCSYASHINQVEEDTYILLLASHYQRPAKIKQIEDLNLIAGTQKIQLLLFDQIYQKAQRQMHPIKQSFKLLDKFDGSESKQLQLKQPISYAQSNNNNSLNQSFISQVSVDSRGQTRKSRTSIKGISKLENQLYQILKLLDLNKKILSPPQIQISIRKYLFLLSQLQMKIGGVNQREYEALQTLDAINTEVTAQEIYLILKNNPNQINLITTYFMDKNKYDRIIAVGKIIATQHLQGLYKSCLKNNLLSLRNSLIPFYLKKIIRFFVNPPIFPKSLKIQEISVPQLIEVIEKKNYDSHFYASILSVIYPQLFTQFQPAIKVIAPLLSFFIEHLISLDHHHQLIYSFIGDLTYQVCYFFTQSKLNSLNNAVYMEDKYSKMLTIKQRRILEMLREGGLRGFGFQVKSSLVPVIQKHKLNTEPEEVLYHSIRIQKSLQLLHFYKFLNSCHYTPTTNKIAKFLQYKNFYSSVLETNRPLYCHVLIKNKNKQVDFKIPSEQQIEEMRQRNAQQSQFNSIAQRILRSQSGIFQDMVKLNPNVKIAGIQLKTAMKNIMTSSRIEVKPHKQKRKGEIDEQQALKAYLTPQLIRSYQYTELALSLKQKYINYHLLTQVEKSYFKDCALTVVEHKEQIFDYVKFSDQIKSLKAQQNLTQSKLV